MAQTLVQFLSGLIGLGGVSRRLADAALSATTLVTAAMDFGADIFSRGCYNVRVKSAGGFSTANGQLSLVVADDSAFATNRVYVPLPNPISAAATQTQPVVECFTGLFSVEPGTFRFARFENAGVVIGGTAVTLDAEVVAVP